MKKKIIIVDYGMGNLRSVEKAFEKAGARVAVSSRPGDIRTADKIVVPGVGAFSHAMKELRRRGLTGPILDKIKKGTPYLGLCLGLQILFPTSQEGRTKGLGLIPGRVVRFSARGGPASGGRRLKVPHMGWNTLKLSSKKCPLFKGVKKDDYFYFVHSFYAVPVHSGWKAATTLYGGAFCSALWKDNVYATQFHPEKSQAAGQRIIRNFVGL